MTMTHEIDPITAKKNAKMIADFEKFHAENPEIYTILVGLAREWVAICAKKSAETGVYVKPKIGIGALYEVARWELIKSTTDPDYKMSNNHRAFYSRLIMAQEPDLCELFDISRSVATDWILDKLDEIEARKSGYSNSSGGGSG